MNTDVTLTSRLPLYAAFYGLKEAPFDLTPNPRFLFLTPRQQEALSNLRYGLRSPKGLTLLLGSPGTGKTTLLWTALAELQPSVNKYLFLSNPALERHEFYEYLAREFGLSAEAARSKARFLFELEEAVEARHAAGGLTGLVVDEAQSLSDTLLEEIRLLGNLETPTSKLLNIVLSGQPELASRLNADSLRQLKQRVALRCELSPLTLEETAAYISGRLRIAGAQPQDVFTRETVIAIHRAAYGVPRTINVLCENALIGGFAAQARPVPVEIVAEVCADFDIGGQPAAAPDATVRPAPAPAPVKTPVLKPAQATTPASVPGRATKLADPPATVERPLFGSVTQPPKRRFFFF